MPKGVIASEAKQSRSTLQILVEITPLRVEPIDQFNFLSARAGFYLFLSGDSTGRILSGFIVDELGHVITAGKFPQQLFAMLMDAP
jgi:hypothetical protein